jgi:hypothetical protein
MPLTSAGVSVEFFRRPVSEVDPAPGIESSSDVPKSSKSLLVPPAVGCISGGCSAPVLMAVVAAAFHDYWSPRFYPIITFLLALVGSIGVGRHDDRRSCQLPHRVQAPEALTRRSFRCCIFNCEPTGWAFRPLRSLSRLSGPRSQGEDGGRPWRSNQTVMGILRSKCHRLDGAPTLYREEPIGTLVFISDIDRAMPG